MAYLWNIFGLADILLVVGTAIYLNNTTPTSISELALFPYGLVAAFAPPTIIFLHISTFKKLNFLRKQI